jgi:hypothetical protein
LDTQKFQNNESEVCAAYVLNSAGVALRAYYALGNNRIGVIADAARQHFETRYFEHPRRDVEQDVDSWPKTDALTGNHVENSVAVQSVSSNLTQSRAFFETRESWKVSSPEGSVLHDEPAHPMAVTMCRGLLPGHILREWIVASDAAQPDFDCIGFDFSHGITP